MDIFSCIMFMGGLAFFLYGMTVLSSGLEKLAGSKLEGILKTATKSRFRALLLGTGITIAIQSSSATTVMLVGLVNSGIMNLGQTVGMIMGSNIGTTITAWILSLAGIEGDAIWVKMLKPENFSMVFAFVGAMMIIISKNKKKRDIGTIFLGFAVLMYGMKLMSTAVDPLSDLPEFQQILTAFQNPLLGVVVGALFTAVIQSSSASVGVLQALSITGGINYAVGLPIIMGQNIGTCITAILSSLGANKNGKRVAIVHVTFNLIGTSIGLIALLVANSLFHISLLDDVMTPFGIAVCHSVFNIVTTLLLLPMAKTLERVAYKVIKDEVQEEESLHIDENLFATPSIALAECVNFTVNMGYIAMSSVAGAVKLLHQFTEKGVEEVEECEDQLDLYEAKLGTYLVKLSAMDLTEDDSHKASELLRDIGDFERVGDHAINILESAQEMSEKGVYFSPGGKEEINTLAAALDEVLHMTVTAFATGDVAMAMRVEPLEQVVDDLVFEIRRNHIQRLQNGICTIELGFILTDLLTDMERISDHCATVASTVVEIDNKGYSHHDYTQKMKQVASETYETEYRQFQDKYKIGKMA